MESAGTPQPRPPPDRAAATCHNAALVMTAISGQLKTGHFGWWREESTAPRWPSDPETFGGPPRNVGGIAPSVRSSKLALTWLVFGAVTPTSVAVATAPVGQAGVHCVGPSRGCESQADCGASSSQFRLVYGGDRLV